MISDNQPSSSRGFGPLVIQKKILQMNEQQQQQQQQNNR
jgi:hypothetical protein